MYLELVDLNQKFNDHFTATAVLVGVYLKLELDKTEDQNIEFGVTRVGGEASRTVSLVNHSKKKIEITFDVENQLE